MTAAVALLLAILIWASNSVMVKHLLRRHRVSVVTVHATLVGTVVLLVVTAPTHAATIGREAAHMSTLAWILVVSMAVVVTIGSNQLFSYGLQRTTAGAAAAYGVVRTLAAHERHHRPLRLHVGAGGEIAAALLHASERAAEALAHHRRAHFGRGEGHIDIARKGLGSP